MRQFSFKLLSLLTACLAAGGCGQASPDATVDIAWPERQSIYRLNAARTQIDVYSLRGGVVPLGSMALPASLCPTAMALDEKGNRLWLWSQHGGVAFDARSLKPVQQWQSVGAAFTAQVPPGVALRSMMFRPATGCDARVKTLQAMTEQTPKN